MFIHAFSHIYHADDACLTPDGQTGICISYVNCDVIVRLLVQNSQVRDPNIESYVQQSLCGNRDLQMVRWFLIVLSNIHHDMAMIVGLLSCTTILSANTGPNYHCPNYLRIIFLLFECTIRYFRRFHQHYSNYNICSAGGAVPSSDQLAGPLRNVQRISCPRRWRNGRPTWRLAVDGRVRLSI